MVGGEGMRCDCCGRFFRAMEPGSSWKFVPDSYLTTEENSNRCKRCTEAYGPLTPNQDVVIDICSGIFGNPNNSVKEMGE